MQLRRTGLCGLLLLSLAGLSGCVTLPPEIRGTSATPQMDLIRVMNAPNLYVGQESRFGGRIADIRNEANRTRLEIASLPLDDAAGRDWANPRKADWSPTSMVFWSRWISRIS